MGKVHKKKRQSVDHYSTTIDTNIISTSAEDCTDGAVAMGKHVKKSYKRLKNKVVIDADTQLKENRPDCIVPEYSIEQTEAKKKSKKPRIQEVIGQNALTTNETVTESNVIKSKKKKRVIAENSVQSDNLKKSDHKIKKAKCQTVVSSDSGSSSKKSKKSSQTAKITMSSTMSTETGRKKKPAKLPKTQKQIVESQTDGETDVSNVMTIPPDSTAKYHALEYLKRWKHQRSEWSFQKVRQVWLLQNMFDEKKVSCEDFNIMVEYLQDLAGKARQSTVDMAEKMIAEAEDEETSDGATVVSEEKFERLRRVIQILS